MASIDRYPGGRWRARWRTPDGQSRSQVFARKIDAERHLTAMEHSKLTGAYIDPANGRTTVEEWWAEWSERQVWRESSRMSITSVFKVHVLPILGRRQLSGLRRGDIEAWAARLPLARPGQVVQYVSSMLEAAVGDGLIASNPARGVKRRRSEPKRVTPLTDEQVDALRDAAPPSFRVALTLGLGAGLRQSEATGLTVDRVDFLRRELTIDRQLVTPKAGPATFGPPKSAQSYRTVPLPKAVVDGLAEHVQVHGLGRDDLLIHLSDGSPIRRQHFGKIWRQVRERASLPTVRFHDTRHTYASVLLGGGVSVAAAADFLGHTPAVLLSTYAHLLPADHDRVRAAVQAAFARGAVCQDGVTAMPS